MLPALIRSVTLFCLVAQASALPPLAPAAPAAHDTPNPWFWLQAYDHTMTRTQFAEVLKRDFDPFGGLNAWLEWSDTELKVYPSPTDHREPQFVLQFATTGDDYHTPPLRYRSPAIFRAQRRPGDLPLQGLRVAIDPGHIGGKWGEIEDRSTIYAGIGRIQEGDMNLITASLLQKNLQALGAIVTLTRTSTEPATPVRPEDLLEEARQYYVQKRPELALKSSPEQIQAIGLSRLRLRADYLFVRKYEFMSRAEAIRQFHPDVSVVLYINATPSSGWSHLIGVDENIFFIHGAYTREEAQDPSQQPRLFYKILDRVTPVEYEVATDIAQAFTAVTGIRAVPYMDSKTTRSISPENPYVVARNLGANRYYDGPVVTTEPYFMNNRIIARRLIAGDFEGEKMIEGQLYGSIFREYADCVTAGLLKAYGSATDNSQLVKRTR